MSRKPFSLLLVLSLGLFASHLTAEATISSAGNKRLETAEVNEAGPGASSSTSGRRQQVSLGGAFAGGNISSSRFQMQAGFLAVALSGSRTAPPNQLDLTVLRATSQQGSPITPEAWQGVADPIFLWDPPTPGLQVAGYSYALDAVPDETVDTTGLSWNVALDPLRRLADGPHTFSVKAIATSGIAGRALSFKIWVDTTPPTVTASTPQPGVLLNTLAPAITVTLSDAQSGIDAQGISLSINGFSTSVSWNQTTGVATAQPGGVVEGPNSIRLNVSDRVGNAISPLVWSFTADVTPPVGSVLINGGALMTTNLSVRLDLAASDAISGVTRMQLSNDSLIGYVEEVFVPVRAQWRLNAVSGTQKVYVKFVDRAGNISTPVFDEIELRLLAPETIIVNGPAGVTPLQTAEFTFNCPGGDCVFSYAFDHEAWSAWSPAPSATKSGLPFGNHYFRVKAAKDVNGTPGIQPEEEDPTPAERTWIVGVETPVIVVPSGAPVKLWRLD